MRNILAVVIDIIYEIVVFKSLKLGQPMIMGLVLVLPAYLLIRGPREKLKTRFDIRLFKRFGRWGAGKRSRQVAISADRRESPLARLPGALRLSRGYWNVM